MSNELLTYLSEIVNSATIIILIGGIKAANQQIIVIEMPNTLHPSQSHIITQSSQNYLGLSLPLNQKLNFMQRKSNKLMQKVLNLQEQIQKYSEQQHKDLRPMLKITGDQFFDQSKQILHLQMRELDYIREEHLTNMRRMAVLGRKKVRMIETLDQQIQQVQKKLTHKSSSTSPIISSLNHQTKHPNTPSHTHLALTSFEQQKNELQQQFTTYNKYKNDIFNHSKSEKFSFRTLRPLMKRERRGGQQQQQVHEQGMNKMMIVEEEEEQVQVQLQRVKEQFSTYQQRVSRQLQSYKERLHSSMLEKEMLRKQLESQKYQSLRQKIFSKNNSTKKKNKPLNNGQHTSRELFSQHFINTNELQIEQQTERHKREQHDDQGKINNQILSGNCYKTDRPTNDEESREEDYGEEDGELQLEGLKNELNKRYVSENEEIVELNSKIKEMEQLVQNLNYKLQNNLSQHQLETTELKNLLQVKQLQLIHIKNSLEQNRYQLTQKLTRMKEQITTLKQSNHQQHQLNNLDTVKIKNNITSTTSNSNKVLYLYGQNISDNQGQLTQQLTQTITHLRNQLQEIRVEKRTRIQELQQNLQILKSDISQQVDQEVNQAIRTFLRYRKHTNRIQTQTVKVILLNKKTSQINKDISKKEISKEEKIKLETAFKEVKVIQPIQLIVPTRSPCKKPIESLPDHLTLRKLIELKFSSKPSSTYTSSHSEQQLKLKLKLHISLSLVTFATKFLNQQLSKLQSSSKSIKPSKKLPSLLPEQIFLIEKESQQKVFLQQILSSLQTQQDFAKYDFTCASSQSMQSQSQKNKTLTYLSPQVLLSMNESQHSYTWTVGVLMDEILNNRPYYSKIQEIIARKDNYKWQNKLGYQDQVIDQLEMLLEKMLRKNFKQRPHLKIVWEELDKILMRCK